MNYAIPLALLLTRVLSQNITVPTTCSGNFTAGTDQVLFTVPYTYSEVMSIIGNFSNLTWSGSPPNSVTLNGTDNTIGTARTYDLAGLHIIETILQYSKPAAAAAAAAQPAGPYVEVHNAALLRAPGVEVYIPYDGTVVTGVCEGKAAMFNFTAHFCSTNVSAAAELLHRVHLTDAQTVGVFLGGRNFSGCEDLGAEAGSGPRNSTADFSSAAPDEDVYTGVAARLGLGAMLGGGAALVFVGMVL